MKYTLTILTICFVISGCSTPVENDPQVLKANRTWDHIIYDPFKWARQQIAEAAPIGKDGGLCSMEEDINDDGHPELFVHADVPASLFVILVFEKAKGGYKYLGSIDSNPNMIISPKNNQIVTYQRCGGQHGTVVTYALKKNHFEVIRLLEVGDGAPDENNKLFRNLFRDINHTWEKVPNKSVHPIACSARSG